MKGKAILALLLSVTLLGNLVLASATAADTGSTAVDVYTVAPDTELIVPPVEVPELKYKRNPELDLVDMDDLTTADEDGRIPLPEDDDLMSFLFPQYLGGNKITKIGASTFCDCPYFRTVIIPGGVTSIGANAFADCDNLEYIVLLSRADTSDMTLGENWAGDAEVVFALVIDEEASAATVAVEEDAMPVPSRTEDAD